MKRSLMRTIRPWASFNAIGTARNRTSSRNCASLDWEGRLPTQLVRDVVKDHLDGGSPAIAERGRRHLHLADPPVEADHLLADHGHLLPVEEPGDALPDEGMRTGVEELHDGLADELPGPLRAEQPERCRFASSTRSDRFTKIASGESSTRSR